MKEDDAMKDGQCKEQGVKTDGMDRREFFITVGKVIIPTLGLLGLSLVEFPSRVQAADRKDCSSTCTSSCVNGCTTSCGANCSSSCIGVAK